MTIEMIVFDLDGTLLDDYKSVPPDNLAALHAAAEKGVLLVPASGRLYSFIPEVVRTLPGARYFITCNGGKVYDAVARKTVCAAEIPLSRALQVLDHMDTLDVIYDCYADDTGYMNLSFMARADAYFPGPVLNSMLHTYTLRTRQGVDDLRRFVTARGRSIQKLQMFFADEELRRHQLEILPELFPDLAVTSSLANNIEINSADATKGRALETLCASLGIASDRVMALGDGTNDLDMFRAAGISVAMQNAEEGVRQAATFVTSSNNDAGFAAALRTVGIV